MAFAYRIELRSSIRVHMWCVRNMTTPIGRTPHQLLPTETSHTREVVSQVSPRAPAGQVRLFILG